MVKRHKFFSNSASMKIGFLCRLVNFLEDILEDADCEDIAVSLKGLEEGRVVVQPYRCSEDYRESINVFSDDYGFQEVSIEEGDASYRAIYEKIIETYASTLHSLVKRLVHRTIETGVEHYVGILFDGKVFVAEGEVNYVRLPRLNECLSIHTHPSIHPLPSPQDLRYALDLLVDRGVGCVIAARSSSLVLYRVGALTLEEYLMLKNIDYTNPYDSLMNIARCSKVIKMRYLP